MQLEWLGQVVCPPGTLPDPSGRCVNPFDPLTTPIPLPPPVVTVPPVILQPAPPSAQREKDRTLLYAATIVAAGILTAVVLSRLS